MTALFLAFRCHQIGLQLSAIGVYYAMRFIETPVFTRAIAELLDDDAYQGLQLALLVRPILGSLIRGTGGLPKMRWAPQGKGNRGGIRIFFFWAQPTRKFSMLYASPKKLDERP